MKILKTAIAFLMVSISALFSTESEPFFQASQKQPYHLSIGAVPYIQQKLEQASYTSDVDRIRQARVDQNHAMAMGDMECAASFWTEDITLCRGLGGLIIGKEAYRDAIDPTANETSLIYVREPDLIEISSHWPLAYESGTWEGRERGADGATVISGRYSAQWVKQEGTWLIRSEVFVALRNSG